MSNETKEIRLIPLPGIPEVKQGDDLAAILWEAITSNGISLEEDDIFVVAQKIVSKAEGRIVDLNDVEPSNFSNSLSKEISKDPRLVEVILSETTKIIKMDQRKPEKGRLIVETRGGVISANAGVDASNVSGGDRVTLLPLDSDESARRLSKGLKAKTGKDTAVIITDTVGRPWRNGLVDIAIGCAGIKALKDYRGERDSKGLELIATEMAVADQVATAAGLLMEKAGSIPVVIVRGFSFDVADSGAAELIRPAEDDLFR